MNPVSKPSKVLGVAFLFQALASLISNAIFLKPLIVDGNITATMTNIANHPFMARTSILIDMFCAAGVIFLGAVLYVTLRKYNEKMALTALGFYILEGALLAAAKLWAFSLLSMSQEYVVAGFPVYLQSMGKLTFETMDFTYNASMLAFSLGAIPFYYLLDKARIVPRFLSLWGLITAVFPCLIATLIVFFGFQVPFFVYLPYAPFEFVIGGWITVKGIKSGSENLAHLALANEAM
jgi:hypothetical protein